MDNQYKKDKEAVYNHFTQYSKEDLIDELMANLSPLDISRRAQLLTQD
jgi:hypothetical protein